MQLVTPDTSMCPLEVYCKTPACKHAKNLCETVASVNNVVNTDTRYISHAKKRQLDRLEVHSAQAKNRGLPYKKYRGLLVGHFACP